MENRMKTQPVDPYADATELSRATRSKALSFRQPRGAYRIVLPAVILLLAISMATARDTDAQTAAASGQKATQILIPGFLTASLDAKKKKPGEEVVVKTAGAVHLADGTVIPRGTKVVGHVTEAKSRSGSDAKSSLGIAFDMIDMPDGKTLAITGVIQAFAPNPNPDQSGGIDYGGMNSQLQHATPTAGGTVAVAPILTEQSVGIQGIKNLELASDGVFKSDGKTIKLDYGSQVVLRAQLGSGS
jgi:hypothetical protein